MRQEPCAMRPTGTPAAREATAEEPPGVDGPAVITGVVDRVLHHRPESGYTVLRLKTGQEQVVLVGVMPSAEPGELLRAQGGWVQDRVWGRQFLDVIVME